MCQAESFILATFELGGVPNHILETGTLGDTDMQSHTAVKSQMLQDLNSGSLTSESMGHSVSIIQYFILLLKWN